MVVGRSALWRDDRALPCAVYERQKDGSKKPSQDHWLYDLVHDSPNIDQTAAEFWEAQVVDLCVHGNAYSLKDKRTDGSNIIVDADLG